MLEKNVTTRHPTVEKRREELTAAYRGHMRSQVERFVAIAAALVVIGMLALWLGPTWLATVTLPVAAANFAIAGHRTVVMQRRPFVSSAQGGNDALGVVEALRALMGELRSGSMEPRRLHKRYETATRLLQAIVPDTPLAHLRREGYYPHWPTRQGNKGAYQYKIDDEPLEHHWSRTVDACDRLCALLSSDGLIMETKVTGAVSALVPPLRAVLRSAGVATHGIEYLAVKASRPDARHVPEEDEGRAEPDAETRGSTVGEDVRPAPFDDVADRMNASASMTAAAIGTLASAFHAADPSLFPGGDRALGEAMLERHASSLKRAFTAADDAAQGEEKDEVRAEFAAALGVMREQLSGIMARHARAARDAMRDEARFIETTHGRSEDI